jgi:hypothetical protein
MLPAIYNLPTGYRGDSYGPLTFYFWDTGNQPIQVGGVNAYLKVKNPLNGCLSLLWSTENNSIATSGNRLVASAILSDHTRHLTEGNYEYDLELSSGDATVTYLKGIFPIIDDV